METIDQETASKNGAARCSIEHFLNIDAEPLVTEFREKLPDGKPLAVRLMQQPSAIWAAAGDAYPQLVERARSAIAPEDPASLMEAHKQWHDMGRMLVQQAITHKRAVTRTSDGMAWVTVWEPFRVVATQAEAGDGDLTIDQFDRSDWVDRCFNDLLLDYNEGGSLRVLARLGFSR